ncbi:MAG: DUF4243 domain-containing protein [Deltaproteobacteria bacterium]|nr:DUF4243 domain-containing protein [Deltaproteobacteria bacterium]
MLTSSYAPIDEALELLSAYGPDLRNGLTNHAPMAVEALCALGRSDAVLPWIEKYRAGMLPRPAAQSRIEDRNWRAALAHPERTTDWSEFFRELLREQPWREVLQQWMSRLASGLCGSATHGVIRVGHAVRSLTQGESSERMRELADALGYLAANYQELPTILETTDAGWNPSEAIGRVALVPPELRRFSGTITSALEGLDAFPEFASVIGLLRVDGDDASRLVSQLTETFARVYLANAYNVLTAIVFIHGVTSAAALRSLLPYLDAETARQALRFGWQAGCGLYAAFGSRTELAAGDDLPRETLETLVDMAVAHGDEHVIKFTEACVHEYALNPAPVYLAAARRTFELMPAQ